MFPTHGWHRFSGAGGHKVAFLPTILTEVGVVLMFPFLRGDGGAAQLYWLRPYHLLTW